MINTKTLRKQFALERATMTRNERIGAWVLTTLCVLFGASFMFVIVRLVCLAIVAIQHAVK